MKVGATYNLLIKLDIEKEFDDVIFTIKAKKKTLSKTLAEAIDGVFIIPLNQDDTLDLDGNVQIEAQINYTDKSVNKSNIKMLYINDSLATKKITDNSPSDNDGIDAVLEVIQGDVALLITPEASADLIAEVTALFQQTKAVADSVRQDADEGKFDGKDGADGKDGRDGVDGKDGIDGKDGVDGKDGIDGKDGKDGIDGQDGADGRDGVDGQDGFSPTVSVKTQTADTYILDITDKNGTIETPNLKGAKGETAYYQDGNGIDITGDTISVDLASDNLLHFLNGKLWLTGYDLKDSQASDNMLVVDNGARGLKITPQIIGTNVDVQYGIAQGSKTRETLLHQFGDGYNIQQRFAPIPTASDNGKFLRVNAQGNAEWQTVPSAESEVY